jgi:hypothetical protein
MLANSRVAAQLAASQGISSMKLFSDFTLFYDVASNTSFENKALRTLLGLQSNRRMEKT